MKKIWMVFLVVFLLFWVKGYLSIDPDFGWHLKMGEYILQYGIPSGDPFSYTMPSFPFVDHEWLQDVLLYKLYISIGYFWIAGIYAAFATFSLIIVSRGKKFQEVGVPILLGSATLLVFAGVRPQVVSWFLFAFVSSLLFDQVLWKRWSSFLPLIFLVWVNLHAGFASGISILIIGAAAQMIQQRKIIIRDIVIVSVSILATLVNPYGSRIWEEVMRVLSDSQSRAAIQEWMPAIFQPDLTLWIFIPFSLLLILRYWKKFSFSQLAIYGFWLLQGIMSIRHIPLWIFIAIPLSTIAVQYFVQEAKAVTGGVKRFALAYGIFTLLIGSCFVLQILIIFFMRNILNETNFYPKQAVAYLQQHPSKEQLFADYSWGGYLIWKLPEKKVFIDGRMPSWRDYDLPKGESDYAFIEYGAMLRDKQKFAAATVTYNIDTVLLPVKQSEESSNIPFQKELEQVIGRTPDLVNFYLILEQSGWKKVYQDGIAVIYRKP